MRLPSIHSLEEFPETAQKYLEDSCFFVFFPSVCLSLTSKFTRMLSQSNWSFFIEYEETFLMFFVVYACLQVFYVCIETKLGNVLAIDPALRKTVRGLYLIFLQVPVSSLLLIAADIAHRLYTVQIAMALVTFGTLSLLWLLRVGNGSYTKLKWNSWDVMVPV